MCFSIPLKVIRVNSGSALVENGRNIKIGNEIKVKDGQYLQVTGNVAVGKLSKNQGLKIRQLIKKLNS